MMRHDLLKKINIALRLKKVFSQGGAVAGYHRRGFRPHSTSGDIKWLHIEMQEVI
jgi:hypothetical protein